MASRVGPAASYTISYGPLTTLWTPHSSCLFTVTSYSGSYYQGYIPSLGVDPACYPPSQAAATASVAVTFTPIEPDASLSTPNPVPDSTGVVLDFTPIDPEASLPTSNPVPDTTTGVVARDLVNAVNLYSPGICPSGWTYALSCKCPFHKQQPNLIYLTDVTTAVAAAPTSAFLNDSFLTATTSHYTYFCCPDGFQLDILTPGPSPTIQVDYASCTSTGTVIETVWDMKNSGGWPTSVPSDIHVYMAELDYEPDGCSIFTVTASGIAVAWAATDTAVIDYLHSELLPAELSEWPPEWPTNTHRPSCVGGSPTWLVPVILCTVFIGGGLCFCCCILWVVRRRRSNRAMLWPKNGAFRERIQAHVENMPLTDVQRAHLVDHTSYPHNEQTHDVESLDVEELPSYGETLAMGDENLDATNAGMLGAVMRAGHIEGERREITIITP